MAHLHPLALLAILMTHAEATAGEPRMAEPEQRPGPSTGEVGDWVHFATAFVLSFLPPRPAELFPSDILWDSTLYSWNPRRRILRLGDC